MRYDMLWRQTHATDVWRFKSPAHAISAPPSTPDVPALGGAREGGCWRGASQERWLVQLLHGAPPPRDPPHPLSGLVAHG